MASWQHRLAGVELSRPAARSVVPGPQTSLARGEATGRVTNGSWIPFGRLGTVAAQIRCCAVWQSRLLTADGLAGVLLFLESQPGNLAQINPKCKVLSVVLLCSLVGSVAHGSFCGSSCIKGKYFHKLCKCAGGVGRSSLSSLNKLVQVHRE